MAIFIPAQIRAGRALLGWSQDELAAKAAVSLSTVRDYENERRASLEVGLANIISALEGGGIHFIQGDTSKGPGVRLNGENPNVVSKPFKANGHEALIIPVAHCGLKFELYVSREAFEELASPGAVNDDFVAYETIFRDHRQKLLAFAATAIAAGRFGDDRRIIVRASDLQQLVL